MRAYLPDYELLVPKGLSHALRLLAENPGARPFAGGTDLMVLLEAGALPGGLYVSLQGLPELSGLRPETGGLSLGALTTYSEIRENPRLRRDYPLLCRAAEETGAIAVQNRGTLGGNIANASPAADSPPALLVYEAELELLSEKGRRRLPYKDFHLGYKRTALEPGELIARVLLPKPEKGLKAYYRKVGARRAQAISKVCLAGLGRARGGRVETLRLALGSVAPVPLRCVKTEAALLGAELTPATIARARTILESEIAPIDDLRSSAEFRRRVSANLLSEFLEALA